jgi:hypothetical protein
MKTLLLVALLCASTALAGTQYVFTPEGTYTISPQSIFSGGYQYSLPRVIITDPCGNHHHGTRYSYGWSFSD